MAGGRYRGRRSLSPYLKLFGLKGAIPPSLHAALRRLQPPSR
jgi:hypothetical protein